MNKPSQRIVDEEWIGTTQQPRLFQSTLHSQECDDVSFGVSTTKGDVTIPRILSLELPIYDNYESIITTNRSHNSKSNNNSSSNNNNSSNNKNNWRSFPIVPPNDFPVLLPEDDDGSLKAFPSPPHLPRISSSSLTTNGRSFRRNSETYSPPNKRLFEEPKETMRKDMMERKVSESSTTIKAATTAAVLPSKPMETKLRGRPRTNRRPGETKEEFARYLEQWERQKSERSQRSRKNTKKNTKKKRRCFMDSSESESESESEKSESESELESESDEDDHTMASEKVLISNQSKGSSNQRTDNNNNNNNKTNNNNNRKRGNEEKASVGEKEVTHTDTNYRLQKQRLWESLTEFVFLHDERFSSLKGPAGSTAKETHTMEMIKNDGALCDDILSCVGLKLSEHLLMKHNA